MIRMLVATPTRFSLLRASAMMSKNPTWSESSAALAPLKEYVWVCSFLLWQLQRLTSRLQITLVKDTVSDKKKKKPHQGYAFIVYEREKDMKGITVTPFPLAPKSPICCILR
jgi:hypothetical protein